MNPAAKDKQTLALLDALVDWQKEDKLFENQQLFKTPIVRKRQKGHRGLPARDLEKRGNKSRFHKKSTPRVLHRRAVCGILKAGISPKDDLI